ncbi:MAG: NAD(P)/FAD-dependent oxidoreductase [Clostridiales bacterium]|nr:NAD(P)/FAD-dependent oxidoreductase [Clostridiales bacterium]
MNWELIVIGAGPAGLAAALAAYDKGLRKIAVIERDRYAGGILNQCIHNGFGLHRFKEELTGPEYALRFIDRLKDTTIELICDTMVLHITADRQVHTVSAENGYQVYSADSIFLAMGCRERPRGAISIPGDRPAGVFTAGTAQRYINLEGYMCARRVVILGSGDIGLIMARRLTLEGAKVLCCVEIMPHSSGLARNISQCLKDFDIPLYLNHTVTEVTSANGRVSSVTVSEVDENRAPIPGTQKVFDCDTLLLSVGLIPENELSREAGIEIDPRTNGPVVYENMETSMPGVFAGGNVVHVHDLVDYVSEESARAGEGAAKYVLSGKTASNEVFIPITNGENVSYTVPQRVRPANVEGSIKLFFRVRNKLGASVIKVSDTSGRQLAAFRRVSMSPGEMENIFLPKDVFEKALGSLCVSASEA